MEDLYFYIHLAQLFPNAGPAQPLLPGSGDAPWQAHPPISDWKVLGRLQELQGVCGESGDGSQPG